MARTTLTAIDPTIAGANVTYSNADAGNGNDVQFDTDLLLLVKNTDGSSHTITLKANGRKVSGIAIADQTFTVGATTGHIAIDDIDRAFFCQSDGKLQLDWSAATGMTICVIKK